MCCFDTSLSRQLIFSFELAVDNCWTAKPCTSVLLLEILAGRVEVGAQPGVVACDLWRGLERVIWSGTDLLIGLLKLIVGDIAATCKECLGFTRSHLVPESRITWSDESWNQFASDVRCVAHGFLSQVGECGNSWKASPRLIQTVQLTVLCHLAGRISVTLLH